MNFQLSTSPKETPVFNVTRKTKILFLVFGIFGISMAVLVNL